LLEASLKPVTTSESSISPDGFLNLPSALTSADFPAREDPTATPGVDYALD
jgi:hypothetical protein